ncbi:PGAP1-like alpha/beta domain-containing protein [Fibrobacter intestinalis]|uniref:PGAP1-like alpha/beta domain-containing protein n=1 Tax=Fibrobacter sp. NR9 TaxID=1896200 RepID=UPI0018E9B723|nr:hypothetical protein [Fibrobacter sp. NR9]
MLHGAYGSDKGFSVDFSLPEAYYAGNALENGATLGTYNNGDRITKWLGTNIFEEPDIGKACNPSNAYIYNWRSFSNPANSSIRNAVELGNRTWNGDGKFGKRRALVEEAQEVKAVFHDLETGRNDSGQSALQLIRRNPALYRQIPSRYILIGHSMGGVVAREYVQNSNYYYGDVDKIITLDSPHEGTGALNMQLDMVDGIRATGEGVTGAIATSGTLGLFLASTGSDLGTSTVGLLGLASSMAASGIHYGVGELMSLFLEKYEPTDPLVYYVDPTAGLQNNISALKGLVNEPDSLPMFRLLAGAHSMTFTDPKSGWRTPLSFFIPDMITVPITNQACQIHGGESFSANYANAFTGYVIGLLGGINVQGHGSSLVETDIGLARHTKMLTNPDVDVRREEFEAASHASEAWTSSLTTVTLAAGAALLAADLIPVPYNKIARAAIATGAAAGISASVASAVSAGMLDLAESHMMPLYRKNLEKWLGNANTFSLVNAGSSEYIPYLMEDFLYECPFVNLALLDSATLDSLQMNPEAKLNRNCYYLGDRENAKCAVGLFANSGDLNSTHKMQSVASLSPLRFSSSTDWSKMGVKVDRWERVDGLTPEGSLAPKSVPIRHVERYAAPSIAVDDWIEKYSFVVDDLMPHRLRQIRMNFNYQEEIAWECDISKDAQASDACVVYKRSGGGEWAVDSSVGDNGRVRHPVQKNGIFDFEPRKYGYSNLLLESYFNLFFV